MARRLQAVSVAVALALLVAATPSDSWLHEEFDTEGNVRAGYDARGQQVASIILDRQSGGAFRSRRSYLYGQFSVQIKLVPGNSAGTVASFYLSSGEGPGHDEIDMEFMGNSSGQPVVLNTNVWANGDGKKERQFYLWFDPAADFHTYTIIWNDRNVLFKVDDLFVRSFTRYADLPYPGGKPMAVHATLWDGSYWATQQGKVKVDWSAAPFVVSYREPWSATLARHGRLAAAATLFSTAVRTTRALNTILAALCSSPSLLRLAPSVLLLAAPTASPDASTFRVLTSALCRPSAAAHLLRCMPSLHLDPDSPLCRAVLSSLCRCAPARDAAAFLDDMRRWGVSPSGLDHRAVLRALLRDGVLVEAYQVVNEKMDSDGVAPVVADFELMLRAFSERGDFDAVDKAFDEMLIRGLVPGVAVYYVYVAALCKKGDLAGARRMLDCMERAGCPPDVRMFGVVVAGCVSAGDAGAARDVAREALRRGLRWDTPSMAELVGLLRAGGHVTHAHGLLLDVFLHGGCIGVDASAFGQLICATQDCAASM